MLKYVVKLSRKVWPNSSEEPTRFHWITYGNVQCDNKVEAARVSEMMKVCGFKTTIYVSTYTSDGRVNVPLEVLDTMLEEYTKPAAIAAE